jgi:diacylglycerol kinase
MCFKMTTMERNKFTFFKRLMSFKHAFNGLKILLREEHNSRIHVFATVVVIILGSIFDLNTYEWIAIIFSIGLVIISEIINTAIENISDFISPEKNEKIKKIKDLSAAAVLVSAITAFLIGFMVFIPKINLCF